MGVRFLLLELGFFISSLTIIRVSHMIRCYLGQWLSLILKRPVVFGSPFCCSIEPTTRCNLQCPECPVGMDQLKREKGELLLNNFQYLIFSFQRHLTYLTLYLQGEPLLNKDLAAMIKIASNFRLYTTISTNGHFLNAHTAAEIVSAGLKKIIISVDGLTQESYEKYRRNGRLEKVTEGITHIVKAKEHAKVKYPLVVIQFIVFRTNEHELKDVIKLGKRLKADKVEIKTAQHYNLDVNNAMITTQDKYRRYAPDPDGNWKLKYSLKNRCIRLWTTAVITWNGLLIPCCYDKDAGFIVGNLNNTTLAKAWKGDKFNLFRKKVLMAKNTVEMCRNCGENQ